MALRGLPTEEDDSNPDDQERGDGCKASQVRDAVFLCEKAGRDSLRGLRGAEKREGIQHAKEIFVGRQFFISAAIGHDDVERILPQCGSGDADDAGSG